MFGGLSTDTGHLLLIGCAASVVLWLTMSVFVVVNRLLYDRRTRRLHEIARELADHSAGPPSSAVRTPRINRLLSRLSRRAVYRMVADVTLPIWITELCAAYSLERWGLPRMIRDASTQRGRRKWRRISALFALGQIRATGIHDLLERAVFDTDPDVAGAAVVVLHRLQDRRAAEILVTALREGSHAPSRIATQLEQFDIPIGDLFRPLLTDPRSHARYWGVRLLGRYPDAAAVVPEIAALANDGHAPVRKAMLETLGEIGDVAGAPTMLRLLDDGVPYVRSTAIRTLARLAARDPAPDPRREVAAKITPFLADAAWDVRLAAKESLVTLGPVVWPEVASALDSPDRFARNGSAEVLQNLGLLDRLIDDVGNGIEPSPELIRVLERAFCEGGPGMIDAAAARSNHELFPSVEALLTRLQFVGIKLLA